MNNKIYVGQTVQPKKRWYQHRFDAANPKISISLAIKKYGAHNFIFEIIAQCKTLDDANYLEELLIKQFDSTNRKIGYNIKLGGNNHTMSEETKRKIAEAHKGKKQAIEHTKKILDTKRNNPLTDETRKKLSEAGKRSPTKFKKGQKSYKGMLGKKQSERWKKEQSERLKNNLQGKACKNKTWKIINGKRVWLEKAG